MNRLMRRGKSHYYYRGYEIIKINGFWRILKNRKFQVDVSCLSSAKENIDAALCMEEV